jgi:acyl-coenzyme A synthetase/AMP-(fatty) acid ligase
MQYLSLFDDGPAVPCPNHFNLAAYVLAAAGRTPDKTALEVYGPGGVVNEVWTFRQLRDAVQTSAAQLQARGIGPGSRVLLRLPNLSDFPIVFLASVALGAVPVPSSPQLTDRELDFIIKDLSPHLICFGEGTKPANAPPGLCVTPGDLLGPSPEPVPGFFSSRPDDLAYIIYTSGTSGTPKAVMHAHRAIWARRMMWDGWYGLRTDDRMLHAGAFNWTYTLGTGLFDPWAKGATALIYTGPPDRRIWADIARRHRPSLFAATPGVYRQILAEAPPHAFASLRHALSAGEKLPQPVRDTWQTQIQKPICEALGMSEVSTYISQSPGTPGRAGTSGRPQPGRRIAVLPERGDTPVPRGTPGQLAVSNRDPGLMLGYRNQPGETAERMRGEWFLTGDMASMDTDGYVTFLGRNDDMLNAGGYRVSPLEIETALLEMPQVTEAAAREVEVRPGVRVIGVFYVSQSPLAEAALYSHCAARLARYKCPRVFQRLESLPRGANGKLRRQDLTIRPKGTP